VPTEQIAPSLLKKNKIIKKKWSQNFPNWQIGLPIYNSRLLGLMASWTSSFVIVRTTATSRRWTTARSVLVVTSDLEQLEQSSGIRTRAPSLQHLPFQIDHRKVSFLVPFLWRQGVFPRINLKKSLELKFTNKQTIKKKR
jgi:hypothetical protein